MSDDIEGLLWSIVLLFFTILTKIIIYPNKKTESVLFTFLNSSYHSVPEKKPSVLGDFPGLQFFIDCVGIIAQFTGKSYYSACVSCFIVHGEAIQLFLNKVCRRKFKLYIAASTERFQKPKSAAKHSANTWVTPIKSVLELHN